MSCSRLLLCVFLCVFSSCYASKPFFTDEERKLLYYRFVEICTYYNPLLDSDPHEAELSNIALTDYKFFIRFLLESTETQHEIVKVFAEQILSQPDNLNQWELRQMLSLKNLTPLMNDKTIELVDHLYDIFKPPAARGKKREFDQSEIKKLIDMLDKNGRKQKFSAKGVAQKLNEPVLVINLENLDEILKLKPGEIANLNVEEKRNKFESHISDGIDPESEYQSLGGRKLLIPKDKFPIVMDDLNKLEPINSKNEKQTYNDKCKISVEPIPRSNFDVDQKEDDTSNANINSNSNSNLENYKRFYNNPYLRSRRIRNQFNPNIYRPKYPFAGRNYERPMLNNRQPIPESFRTSFDGSNDDEDDNNLLGSMAKAVGGTLQKLFSPQNPAQNNEQSTESSNDKPKNNLNDTTKNGHDHAGGNQQKIPKPSTNSNNNPNNKGSDTTKKDNNPLSNMVQAVGNLFSSKTPDITQENSNNNSNNNVKDIRKNKNDLNKERKTETPSPPERVRPSYTGTNIPGRNIGNNNNPLVNMGQAVGGMLNKQFSPKAPSNNPNKDIRQMGTNSIFPQLPYPTIPPLPIPSFPEIPIPRDIREKYGSNNEYPEMPFENLRKNYEELLQHNNQINPQTSFRGGFDDPNVNTNDNNIIDRILEDLGNNFRNIFSKQTPAQNVNQKPPETSFRTAFDDDNTNNDANSNNNYPEIPFKNFEQNPISPQTSFRSTFEDSNNEENNYNPLGNVVQSFRKLASPILQSAIQETVEPSFRTMIDSDDTSNKEDINANINSNSNLAVQQSYPPYGMNVHHYTNAYNPYQNTAYKYSQSPINYGYNNINSKIPYQNFRRSLQQSATPINEQAAFRSGFDDDFFGNIVQSVGGTIGKLTAPLLQNGNLPGTQNQNANNNQNNNNDFLGNIIQSVGGTVRKLLTPPGRSKRSTESQENTDTPVTKPTSRRSFTNSPKKTKNTKIPSNSNFPFFNPYFPGFYVMPVIMPPMCAPQCGHGTQGLPNFNTWQNMCKACASMTPVNCKNKVNLLGYDEKEIMSPEIEGYTPELEVHIVDSNGSPETDEDDISLTPLKTSSMDLSTDLGTSDDEDDDDNDDDDDGDNTNVNINNYYKVPSRKSTSDIIGKPSFDFTQTLPKRDMNTPMLENIMPSWNYNIHTEQPTSAEDNVNTNKNLEPQDYEISYDYEYPSRKKISTENKSFEEPDLEPERKMNTPTNENVTPSYNYDTSPENINTNFDNDISEPQVSDVKTPDEEVEPSINQNITPTEEPVNFTFRKSVQPIPEVTITSETEDNYETYTQNVQFDFELSTTTNPLIYEQPQMNEDISISKENNENVPNSEDTTSVSNSDETTMYTPDLLIKSPDVTTDINDRTTTSRTFENDKNPETYSSSNGMAYTPSRKSVENYQDLDSTLRISGSGEHRNDPNFYTTSNTNDVTFPTTKSADENKNDEDLNSFTTTKFPLTINSAPDEYQNYQNVDISVPVTSPTTSLYDEKQNEPTNNFRKSFSGEVPSMRFSGNDGNIVTTVTANVQGYPTYRVPEFGENQNEPYLDTSTKGYSMDIPTQRILETDRTQTDSPLDTTAPISAFSENQSQPDSDIYRKANGIDILENDKSQTEETLITTTRANLMDYSTLSGENKNEPYLDTFRKSNSMDIPESLRIPENNESQTDQTSDTTTDANILGSPTFKIPVFDEYQYEPTSETFRKANSITIPNHTQSNTYFIGSPHYNDKTDTEISDHNTPENNEYQNDQTLSPSKDFMGSPIEINPISDSFFDRSRIPVDTEIPEHEILRNDDRSRKAYNIEIPEHTIPDNDESKNDSDNDYIIDKVLISGENQNEPYLGTSRNVNSMNIPEHSYLDGCLSHTFSVPAKNLNEQNIENQDDINADTSIKFPIPRRKSEPEETLNEQTLYPSDTDIGPTKNRISDSDENQNDKDINTSNIKLPTLERETSTEGTQTGQILHTSVKGVGPIKYRISESGENQNEETYYIVKRMKGPTLRSSTIQEIQNGNILISPGSVNGPTKYSNSESGENQDDKNKETVHIVKSMNGPEIRSSIIQEIQNDGILIRPDSVNGPTKYRISESGENHDKNEDTVHIVKNMNGPALRRSSTIEEIHSDGILHHPVLVKGPTKYRILESGENQDDKNEDTVHIVNSMKGPTITRSSTIKEIHSDGILHHPVLVKGPTKYRISESGENQDDKNEDTIHIVKSMNGPALRRSSTIEEIHTDGILHHPVSVKGPTKYRISESGENQDDKNEDTVHIVKSMKGPTITRSSTIKEIDSDGILHHPILIKGPTKYRISESGENQDDKNEDTVDIVKSMNGPTITRSSTIEEIQNDDILVPTVSGKGPTKFRISESGENQEDKNENTVHIVKSMNGPALRRSSTIEEIHSDGILHHPNLIKGPTKYRISESGENQDDKNANTVHIVKSMKGPTITRSSTIEEIDSDGILHHPVLVKGPTKYRISESGENQDDKNADTVHIVKSMKGPTITRSSTIEEIDSDGILHHPVLVKGPTKYRISESGENQDDENEDTVHIVNSMKGPTITRSSTIKEIHSDDILHHPILIKGPTKYRISESGENQDDENADTVHIVKSMKGPTITRSSTIKEIHNDGILHHPILIKGPTKYRISESGENQEDKTKNTVHIVKSMNGPTITRSSTIEEIQNDGILVPTVSVKGPTKFRISESDENQEDKNENTVHIVKSMNGPIITRDSTIEEIHNDGILHRPVSVTKYRISESGENQKDKNANIVHVMERMKGPAFRKSSTIEEIQNDGILHHPVPVEGSTKYRISESGENQKDKNANSVHVMERMKGPTFRKSSTIEEIQNDGILHRPVSVKGSTKYRISESSENQEDTNEDTVHIVKSIEVPSLRRSLTSEELENKVLMRLISAMAHPDLNFGGQTDYTDEAYDDNVGLRNADMDNEEAKKDSPFQFMKNSKLGLPRLILLRSHDSNDYQDELINKLKQHLKTLPQIALEEINKN